MDRRSVLAKVAVAGTIMWAAPAIVNVSPAAAATSGPATVTGSSGLWKWSANPPTVGDVCSTGPAGTANRGTADFLVTCTTDPQTVSVTITVSSGPALSGANARDVKILQSNATGNCIVQSSVGTYNSANGIAVTLGPTPVLPGTTHFSMVMLQTGGGGTDTYTTNRVALACA